MSLGVATPPPPFPPVPPPDGAADAVTTLTKEGVRSERRRMIPVRTWRLRALCAWRVVDTVNSLSVLRLRPSTLRLLR
jgi:hypothetical protein